MFHERNVEDLTPRTGNLGADPARSRALCRASIREWSARLQSASIKSVATLYVRDVPEPLYKRLRARARRSGRSLNAEVIDMLEDGIERELDAARLTERLAELARRIDYPADAPKPEDLIREDRDSR
jgi:plasmid stability protein